MSFVGGPVTVEVPATSANLGPGFDAFGLALDYGDTLRAEVADELSIDVKGEGAATVPLDASHLVVRAMSAAFDEMGLSTPGVRLHCTNRIPHSRGQGSSSAAIVGGIRLAVALVADETTRLDDAAMLALADRMEGHPDNVAPALLGGFVIAGTTEERLWWHRFDVLADLDMVTFVPERGLDTEVARGVLPLSVSHADAAANSARAALVALGLTRDPRLLMEGTEDFLHQRYRAPVMPQSHDLALQLRADGIPAVISGAGPTVLAFVVDRTVEEVVDRAPEGWRAEHRRASGPGVRVLDATGDR